MKRFLLALLTLTGMAWTASSCQFHLALQTKTSSADRMECPGPNDSLVGGGTVQGRQEAKGVWVAGGWGGEHTYPDGGEPLVVQSVAAWGKRSRSTVIYSSDVCSGVPPIALSRQALKVQNRENTEAPMPYALKEAAARCRHRLSSLEI